MAQYCPFCGDQRRHPYVDSFGAVRCIICNAQGPGPTPERDLAEAAWERRKTPPNTLTENRVWAVLGDSSRLFTTAELDELREAANADPCEGAEWLPYYKMALSILVGALGEATGGLDGIAQQAKEKGFTAMFKHIRNMMCRINDTYLTHLRVVGNGPLNPVGNEKHFAKTEAAIAAERARLEAEMS